jgi:hypothetical protein
MPASGRVIDGAISETLPILVLANEHMTQL